MATMAQLGLRRPLALPGIRLASVLQWLFFIAVTAAIAAPVAMVTIGAFNVGSPLKGFEFGLSNWSEAWTDRRLLGALWNTFTIVGTRALLGMLIAIPLAWLLTRTDMPGAKYLEFGFWIAFFMPSLAFLQGWIFLLEGGRGLFSQLLSGVFGLNPMALDIYSYWGIIWVHVNAHTVSALTILLALGFRNMDSSLEEAARISGATKWTTLRHIILPLSRPMIAMVVMVAIIRGMQSYDVEAVLGSPTRLYVYSTLVVNMIADEPPRLVQSSALSTLILVILIPLIAFQRLYVGRRHYTTVSSKMKTAVLRLGRWRWPAFGLVSLVVAFQILVPSLGTIASSFMRRTGYFAIDDPWTLRWWKTVLSREEFISCLVNTLALGIISALAAAAVCFLIAFVIVRTSFPARHTLDLVSWLPWAVPGVLLGLGLVSLVFAVPSMHVLHGSMLMLVLAIVLFSLPLGVQLLKNGLGQISRELEEASTICGSGHIRTQWRINVPILTPMLISVGLMTFVTAVNEVSGVVLLASTETRTLSLLSLSYTMNINSGKENAAVVTTIMILLCIGVALGARVFGIRLGEGGSSEGRRVRS